jgi:hypothetical protein
MTATKLPSSIKDKYTPIASEEESTAWVVTNIRHWHQELSTDYLDIFRRLIGSCKEIPRSIPSSFPVIAKILPTNAILRIGLHMAV